MVDLLMPLAVFGSFVLVMGQLTRLGSNLSLNRTMREALRSDPASVPILAERLDARQPWADALLGWIFIAFAVGLVIMSLFEPVGERREVVQAAIVPALVGVVILYYVRMAKRALADEAAVPAPPMTAQPATRRRTKST
jgi:hypothetical protein